MRSKVLVTGAGALLGQGIIRSLRRVEPKEKYEIIAVDPDDRAVGLYWADRRYPVPLASSPEYIEAIRRILEKEQPQALLIGTDVELGILSLVRHELEASYGTRIIVSSSDVIDVADDKWKTCLFLKKSGFRFPRSAVPSDPTSLEELLSTCRFPFVVKPRIGARSVGLRIANNRDELNRYLHKLRDPVVQECVGSNDSEYTSGVIVVRGKAQAIVTMRRDLKDGNTYRAYVEPYSRYDSELKIMAETLGVDGPVNFQFRAVDERPVVFEINARFSGTTYHRALAGFNEVDALLDEILAGKPIEQNALKRITILRYWDEIVLPADDFGSRN